MRVEIHAPINLPSHAINLSLLSSESWANRSIKPPNSSLIYAHKITIQVKCNHARSSSIYVHPNMHQNDFPQISLSFHIFSMSRSSLTYFQLLFIRLLWSEFEASFGHCACAHIFHDYYFFLLRVIFFSLFFATCNRLLNQYYMLIIEIVFLSLSLFPPRVRWSMRGEWKEASASEWKVNVSGDNCEWVTGYRLIRAFKSFELNLFLKFISLQFKHLWTAHGLHYGHFTNQSSSSSS